MTLKFPCLAPPGEVTVNGKATPWSYDAKELAVVVRTPPQDGLAPTVVQMKLPDNAGAISQRLFGLKGVFRRDDALAAALKPAFRRIHWAANLPDSFQTFWQTRAAIAAAPAHVDEILRRREEAWKAFLDDFGGFAEKLPEDLVRRVEEAGVSAGGRGALPDEQAP